MLKISLPSRLLPPAVQDLRLKAAEDVQGFFVKFRVKAGGEVGVYENLGVGVAALEHHGVADNADVAHQAAELNPVRSGSRDKTAGSPMSMPKVFLSIPTAPTSSSARAVSP